METTNPNNEMKFDAVITREASQLLSKGNGAKYVLHTALIQSGALKGKTVTCARTLVNKDGKEKSGVTIGEEVTLHARIVTNGAGQSKPFFEIQSGSVVTEDAEILAMLGGQSL